MPNLQIKEPETILVVDDDRAVLRYVGLILEKAHFHVISADSGPNALRVAENTAGRIDLVLSDWDMPEMSGIALGEALKKVRPDIHVMQMSGGAHDTLMVLNYGWAFLQKPFVGAKLVAMVKEVLNSPNRSQLGGESFDSRLDTNRSGVAGEDEPKDTGS